MKSERYREPTKHDVRHCEVCRKTFDERWQFEAGCKLCNEGRGFPIWPPIKLHMIE